MKILSIRGENIASLAKRFELDFTSFPLDACGIFVITGPTGSGKSSILDALCLSLYDRAPRLEKLERQAVIDRQSGREMQQSDTRQILRRNAVSGFAETDFRGVDGKTYRARWSVRRAYGKVSGRMGSVEMELTDLTENRPVPGRKNEIESRIAALVGLTFEQFTRTVLLSQGGFAAFLKADQKEKAGLLEKLTGSEIYSRISSAIYERYVQSEKALAEVRARHESLQLLTEDEYLEWKRRAIEGMERKSALQARVKELEARLVWWKERDMLLQALEQARQQYLQVIDLLEANREKHCWIERYDNAQQIRDTYQKWSSAVSEIRRLRRAQKESERMLEERKALYRQVSELWTETEKKYEEFQMEWERSEPERMALRQKAVQIAHCEDLYRRDERQRSALEKEWEAKRLEYRRFSEKRQEEERRSSELEAFLEKSADWESVLENMPYWKDVLRRYQDARTRGSDCRKQYETYQALRRSLELRKAEAEARLERMENQVPSYVLDLRRRLRHGEPCPVCGSLHHPYIHGKEMAGQQAADFDYDELLRQREKGQEELKALAGQIEKNAENLAAVSAQSEHFENECRVLARSISTAFSAWKNCDSLLAEGRLSEALERFHKQWQEKKEEYEALVRKSTVQRSAAGLLEQALSEAGQRYRQASVEAENSKKRWEEEKKDFDPERLASWEETYANQAREWNERIEELRGALRKSESELARGEGERESLRHSLERLRIQVVGMNREIAIWRASQDFSSAELASLFSVSPQKVEALRKELQEYGNRKVSAESIRAERQAKLESHDLSDYNDPEQPASLVSAVLQEKEAELKQQTESLQEAERRIRAEDENRERSRKIAEEMSACRQDYADWSVLKDEFGSARGDVFKNIAQQYNLDMLLYYANGHLKDISARYSLQRIPESLVLQVIDHDMLEEIRPVQTLSGGETFLVSLALALALASMSSMQMQVDSLFIDEGFGTLDSDTLSTALGALEKLQMQGKTIGVISHVAELNEKIACRVSVTRTGEGRSEVSVGLNG